MEAEPINPSTPSTVRCVHPGKEDPRRFNILVVGESGIGKTTFLNTVFKAYTEKDCSVVRTDRTDDIVEVGRFYVKSDGNASDFDVTLFDSPGYGDLVDNQVYIDTLCNFVSERHSRWLALENDLSEAERLIRDDRVHCVIHFIAPHRLKRLDISCMRQLHCLAPTVPVVAKADSMTPDERRKFLEYAHEKLNEFSISSPFGLCNLAGENSDSGKDSAGSESIACDDEIEDEVIYPSLPAGSPLTSSDESPWIPPIKTSTTSSINVPTANEKRSNATLSNVESSHQSDMPVPGGNHSPESSKFTDGQVTLFCVVSDPSFHRVYPWGTCEVENEEHSDLMQLQRILFEGNLSLVWN